MPESNTSDNASETIGSGEDVRIEITSQGASGLELVKPETGQTVTVPIEVLQTGQRIPMEDARIDVAEDGQVTVRFPDGGTLILQTASGISVQRPDPGEVIEYPIENVTQILASPYPDANLALDESGRLALVFSDEGRIVFLNSEAYAPTISAIAGQGDAPVEAILRSVVQLHVARRLAARFEEEITDANDQGQWLTPYDPGDLPPGLDNLGPQPGEEVLFSVPEDDERLDDQEEDDGDEEDDPQAVDDLVTTPEDTRAVFDVLQNDSDPNGDPLRVIAFTPTSIGQVNQIANGQFSYDPEADFNGIQTFSYTVTDDNGGETASATVTIEVTPVNDDPVANDDAARTNEDVPIPVSVLANDSDADGDPLKVISSSDGANGTTTVNADGTITYEPNQDFNGADSFTYTITDGNGGATQSATVNVTVIPVNDDPAANDDAAKTPEDTAVSVDVLANDTDVDGDALTVIAVTNGANGTATINSAGTLVTYTPVTDYNGPDFFTYTITDGNGGATQSASVSVTVTPVNDPPVALDDSVTTREDTPLDITVLSNDFDVDGDALTVIAAADGANGTTTVNADGTISYDPDPNFFGDDSFTYTITDGQGGTDTATVSLSIDEGAPTLLSVNDVIVDESAGQATFIVTRSGNLSGPASVDFVTGDFSATDPEDFTGTSGTLSFAAGEAAATIVVDIIDDNLDEDSELFLVHLQNPVGATVIDNLGVGVIVDNDGSDTVGPRIYIDDVAVDEGAGFATFTVTRVGDLSNPTAVDFATADGTAIAGFDYTATSGTLTFGADVSAQTIVVAITEDAVDEPLEAFQVNLDNAQGGVILDNTGVGLILDNNNPPENATLVAINNVTVDETDGFATFTVSRAGDLTGTSSVDFATSNGSAVNPDDYTGITGTVSFGVGEASKSVVVQINDDAIFEGDEQFVVTLSNPVGTGIAQDTGVGTILDDETGAHALLAINDVIVDESAGQATFIVTRSGNPTPAITVDFVTGDGSAVDPADYTGTSGTLSFASGEVSKTIVVDIADDSLDEPSELFVVQLLNATQAIVIDDTGVGTIIDNDGPDTVEPRIYIDDVVVDESDGFATFTVTREGDLTDPTTVDFATADGSALAGQDYTATSGTLSFAGGQSSATLVVAITEDTTNEALEAFQVNLTNATNGAIIDKTGVGVIVDNDNPHDTSTLFAIDSVTVAESDGTATFTVTRTGDLSNASTVDFQTGHGSAVSPDDFGSTSGTLNFSAGQASATIVVSIVDDTLFEPTEQFVVRLSNATGAAIAIDTGVGTIVDLDSPPVISAVEDTAVSEEGLAGTGISDSDGTPDTTNNTVDSGEITASDADGDTLAYTLSAPTAALTSGGVAITWTGDGTDTLTGRAGSRDIILITVSAAGLYTVELLGPVDHAIADDIENDLTFAVGVTVSDGTYSDSANLLISIEDDKPAITNIEDAALQNEAGLTVSGDITAGAGGDEIGSWDVNALDDLDGTLSFGKSFASDGSVTLTATDSNGATFYVLTLDASTGTYDFELLTPRPITFTSIDFSAVSGGGPSDTLTLTVELDGDTTTTEQIVFDGILVDSGFLTDGDGVTTDDIDNDNSSEEKLNPSASGFGVSNNNLNNTTVGGTVYHEGFVATVSSDIFAMNLEIVNPGAGATVYWQAFDDGALVCSNFDLGTQTGGTLVTGSGDVPFTEINSTNTGGKGFDEVRIWIDVSGGGVKIQNFELGTLSSADSLDLAFEAILTDNDGDSDSQVFYISLAGDQLVTGTSSPETLTGGSGDDILVGYAGNDIIDGGDGVDRVDYNLEAGGGSVSVDLSAGTATDSFGDTDTLNDIEDVVGTDLGDSIVGDAFANKLQGRGGDDIISGGGGEDELIGGFGADTLTGGGDSDRFVIDVVDIGSPDTITDFDPTAATGDTLVLQDLLVGFDPATSNLSDFVSLFDDGTDTTIRVDIDGVANGASFTDVATLENVTGFTLNDLLSGSNLEIE